MEWTTQKKLADQLGVKVQNVHNWIQRKNGRLITKKDKRTGIILVKLKDNKLTDGSFDKINVK